jgi:hypothetical protein
MDPPNPPHSRKNRRARRVLSFALQGLLALVTAALIYAIWLPVKVGPSEEKKRRDARQWLRSIR